MIETPVCIVGAGPGGAATALKLSYLGIPCVLIDKASFPRNKVCGDALSGKVTMLLNRLDPAILKRFDASIERSPVWGIRFFAPNQKEVHIPFEGFLENKLKKPPGYICKRIHFDNFLIDEVKRRSSIQLFEATEIASYERNAGGYRVMDTTGEFIVQCQLLIVAEGAQSKFSRHHAQLEKDPKHYAAAVQAYFKNVEGMGKREFLELHFVKELTPGYFWIFPLPNNQVNIGLGMPSWMVQERRTNLKKELERLVTEYPAFKERFKNAEMVGSILGYGLPLGSKTRKLTGDHFMLIGDAGHLIDPLTGEGIGNAFYSGFIAAEQAEACLAANNFSDEFLQAYDVRVQRVLGQELKLSYRLQQYGTKPWLLNFIATIINANPKILTVFSKMYSDLSLREEITTLKFWVSLFFGKRFSKKVEKKTT